MSLEEFYHSIAADYTDVINRFGAETIVKRFG